MLRPTKYPGILFKKQFKFTFIILYIDVSVGYSLVVKHPQNHKKGFNLTVAIMAEDDIVFLTKHKLQLEKDDDEYPINNQVYYSPFYFVLLV